MYYPDKLKLEFSSNFNRPKIREAYTMDTRIIKTGQPWMLIINFKIQYAEKTWNRVFDLKDDCFS